MTQKEHDDIVRRMQHDLSNIRSQAAQTAVELKELKDSRFFELYKATLQGILAGNRHHLGIAENAMDIAKRAWLQYLAEKP